VNHLCLQEKVINVEIEIEKGMGTIDRADPSTKPEDGGSLKQHLQWTGQEIIEGRLD